MVSLFRLHARQILDSRGYPTIEVEAELSDGSVGRASIPSGASTGSHEALELRDKDPSHYLGKGVLQAVDHVNTVIAPHLEDNDPFDQAALDQEMLVKDGSENLSNWGANAVLGISLAIAKAAATSRNLPFYRYLRQLYLQQGGSLAPQAVEWQLPTPMFNVMNGGAHTRWESTDFQEFMIIPLTCSSFAQCLEQGSLIYHYLGKLLPQQGLSSLVGDEGGFAPKVASNEAAVQLLIDAIQHAGLREGIDVGIGIDAATSELFEHGQYVFKKEAQTLTSAQMVEFWQKWLQTYPITSLEDGCAEDDWEGWHRLTSELSHKIMIVGDDLLVTNPDRIALAIQQKACTALLMKINQIGTLTQSFAAVKMARNAGWDIIVSHRSGETEDTSIADIAVAVGAEYVKMGAPARSERTAKYNQLLRIEEELQQTANR